MSKRFNPMYDKSNLDPKIKKLWINELRSGKRKQARGYLCRINSSAQESFCCLGVLADITLDTYWYPVIGLSTEQVEHVGYKIKDNTQDFSIETLRKIRLSFKDQRSLVRMNDELNYNFKQIANWIEEHL